MGVGLRIGIGMFPDISWLVREAKTNTRDPCFKVLDGNLLSRDYGVSPRGLMTILSFLEPSTIFLWKWGN